MTLPLYYYVLGTPLGVLGLFRWSMWLIRRIPAVLYKPVVNDYRTAPVDEKLRTMRGLLETFTLYPDQLTPKSILAVLTTGVTREAIRDAFYVAFLFNTYDRLADTLGWELPDQRYYPKAGQFLLKRGYL